MRRGAFAVGAGTAEEITPASVCFQDEMMALNVAFNENMFLLPAEQAAASKRHAAAGEEPGVTVPEPEPEPGTQPTLPGPEPTPSPKPAEERVGHFAIRVTGIPTGRTADLSRGVIEFRPEVP